LFRGGAEGHIRQYLIKEKNYLDAVICLPIFLRNEYPDLYFGLEESERCQNILFIEARKGKTQNVLRKEDIDKIISISKIKPKKI
jgi:type I restriction enzyme M protein